MARSGQDAPSSSGYGFRAIAPGHGGFGRSSRPSAVAAYALANAVDDMTGLLDSLGVDSAHVVGHAGSGRRMVYRHVPAGPGQKLVLLSAGHLRAGTLWQGQMAWYQLFFQFEGIAQATLAYDDWAWLRRFSRGDGDQERHLHDLSRPGVLSASLNWYRADLAPPDAGAGARASRGAGRPPGGS